MPDSPQSDLAEVALGAIRLGLRIYAGRVDAGSIDLALELLEDTIRLLNAKKKSG
jgi:hypothetical protein